MWARPTGYLHSEQVVQRSSIEMGIWFLGEAVAECQGQVAVLIEASGVHGDGKSVHANQFPGMISADRPGCLAPYVSTVF